MPSQQPFPSSEENGRETREWTLGSTQPRYTERQMIDAAVHTSAIFTNNMYNLNFGRSRPSCMPFVLPAPSCRLTQKSCLSV